MKNERRKAEMEKQMSVKGKRVERQRKHIVELIEMIDDDKVLSFINSLLESFINKWGI